jgi:DNA-binding MarR family transcriptional regulator
MSKQAAHPISSKATRDADVRNVLDAIRQIVRVLRLGSSESERSVGLSAAQLFVLQKLAEASVLSVNEVAERTHTHQSSVSVVVQRLVDRGLVSRKRSPEDARQMQLSVTPAGRAILRSAPAAAQDRLIGALLQLSPRDLDQLARSLRRMLDLLGIDQAGPATMLFEEEHDASPPRAKSKSRSKTKTSRIKLKGSS